MRTVTTALGAAVLACVFAAAAPAPAHAQCFASAAKSVFEGHDALGRSLMRHSGSVYCGSRQDLLSIKLCAERHRKDGSGVWDSVGCVSGSRSDASTISRIWVRYCAPSYYFRSRVTWTSVDNGWGGGDFVGVVSTYTQCR